MTLSKHISSTELTRSAGCTRKALRYYQSRGLIRPAHSSGNCRYDASTISRLRLIVALREAGVAVDDIAAVLAARERLRTNPQAAPEFDRRDPVSDVVASLGDRIAALERLREHLISMQDATL